MRERGGGAISRICACYVGDVLSHCPLLTREVFMSSYYPFVTGGCHDSCGPVVCLPRITSLARGVPSLGGRCQLHSTLAALSHSCQPAHAVGPAHGNCIMRVHASSHAANPATMAMCHKQWLGTKSNDPGASRSGSLDSKKKKPMP